jgi:hypothetical protein
MKVKVLDIEITALRRNAVPADTTSLLLDDRAGVLACDV